MYKAPQISDILVDLRSSVKAEVAGTDPWIWPNNLVPVLKAFAQAMRAGYLRLEFIHEQAFVTTARDDYLDYHGIQAGGLSRDPASYAQGVLTGTVTLGTVIPDNVQFMRADGQYFAVVGTVTAIANPINVYVRAVVAGELGNTDPGAVLALVTPIPGVSTLAVDANGLLGGAEQESDDSFRQRILYYKQNPPHGGSPPEYIEWCQTKPGVTRVFVKRATPQPGSVTVYFMMDDIGNGIPTPADVSEMQSILNQLAPSDADVIVAAPNRQVVNVTVTGLVPDTPAMRDAVTDELKACFLRQPEPASVIQPFTFAKAWLDEAVSMAPGWRRHKITVPPDDIIYTTAGDIPVLGTITFA
jgi:uncharacterized phage protein gp47/JayE